MEQLYAHIIYPSQYFLWNYYDIYDDGDSFYDDFPYILEDFLYLAYQLNAGY